MKGDTEAAIGDALLEARHRRHCLIGQSRQVGAQPGQVAPEVIHRLGLAYAPTIVVLNLIALAFLSTYGISRASHEANLRRLERG